jgi:glycosyltransferase involved in cell wall biosynthesis
MRIIHTSVDDGGCGNYRVRQPFSMIKKYTEHDVHIVDTQSDDMVAIADAMRVADLIGNRQGSGQGMYKILSYPEFKDKKWTYDIDDNTEAISPYNFHYDEYGTEEFKDKSGKWIWKDGVNNFDLAKNRNKISWHLWAMKNASLVTVTTKKLAEYAKQYNKNVAVLPNCINLDRWWKLNLKPNKRKRVIWSGGVSHYEDWYSIKEPLNQLMRELDFDLVMIGADFKGIIDQDNQKRLILEDWVPFKGHSYRMMCMAGDVAIIPLANLPFNHYKSSIKWYEMSAMEVPSVVSNILPYSEDIKNDENALAYKTEKEFYDSLKTLLLDEKMRLKIGKNARKWVEDNKDAKKCVNLWTDAYKSII